MSDGHPLRLRIGAFYLDARAASIFAEGCIIPLPACDDFTDRLCDRAAGEL